MTVFTSEEIEFWDTNGYVILQDAVPPDHLAAVVEAIWDCLEMNPYDPDSWYSDNHSPKGFVELYHHQALWNNRQYPRVYEAFTELLHTTELWCSIDRVNMKPPVKSGWDQKGFIHWDFDSRTRPIPFVLQGVLCLTETLTEQGGFQCVPGFHRIIETWCKSQPEDRDPFYPDLAGLDVKAIPGRAGDLIIWHQALPHGNGPNRTDTPRLAQYITMFPSRFHDEYERRLRIQSWSEKLPIKFWRYNQGQPYPEDITTMMPESGSSAVLSELGRKLLGLESW